ncbi:ABC transporter ATP-binding protein [Streptomyces sp. NPDC001478]
MSAPAPSARPAVHVRGLRRAFEGRAVLDGLRLDIARGEFVALLGASGSGKTTLLRILGALDSADGGEVLVPEARTIVFQEPRLVPSKRVLANVTVALPRDRAADGLRALAEVGLERHAAAWPATLSGGEAQRVALARALVREPELLLLDEPFAALDALTRLKMQDLVGELCRRHRPAVLLVTHDVDEAVRLADRVAVLRDGRLVTDEPVTVERPRDPGDPAFAALRRRLLADLGVETAPPAPPPAGPSTAQPAPPSPERTEAGVI